MIYRFLDNYPTFIWTPYEESKTNLIEILLTPKELDDISYTIFMNRPCLARWVKPFYWLYRSHEFDMVWRVSRSGSSPCRANLPNSRYRQAQQETQNILQQIGIIQKEFSPCIDTFGHRGWN